MAHADRSLWGRIAGHALDASGAHHPFSARLAEAEGWSLDDTARVVEEYRRFLYLATRTDVPVAPPAPIDAAWRVHLLDTRAYWQDFVPGVLRNPLHRSADTLGDAEARKAFWQASRAAYIAEFGDRPPPDIWVHPGRPDWGGLTATFLIFGIVGGFLSFALMFLVGWLTGVSVGGETDTTVERIGAIAFVSCWVIGFGSPLWAWLVTRFQSRLKTSKRSRNRASTEIGISFGERLD